MRPVNRLSGFAILATLVAQLCILPPTAYAEETLRVVVHESAKIPGPQLAGALVVATELFKAVNIHLEWYKPSEAGDGWPSVVVASSASFAHGAFGPASVLGRVVQPRVRAYVLYDRVAQLASRYRADPTAILGQVLAHEVGHLAFGEQHSSAGLMAGKIRPGSIFEHPGPLPGQLTAD